MRAYSVVRAPDSYATERFSCRCIGGRWIIAARRQSDRSCSVSAFGGVGRGRHFTGVPCLSLSSAEYVLDFEGNASTSSTVRFRFTNPLAIYPATYIWKLFPRRQAGYYTTFFWGNDDGRGDLNTFLWDKGGADSYYGPIHIQIRHPTAHRTIGKSPSSKPIIKMAPLHTTGGTRKHCESGVRRTARNITSSIGIGPTPIRVTWWFAFLPRHGETNCDRFRCSRGATRLGILRMRF